ncbi:MAG: AAA family ATPase [Angelakisella sp.]|nr:AAA family ATPase [Angelakisella sp.]
MKRLPPALTGRFASLRACLLRRRGVSERNRASLGLLTVNALTTCDRVLITTTPQFFSTKGLELLIDSIRSFNSPDPPVSRTSGTGGRCQAPRLCGSPHHLPASRYPVAPLSPNHPGRLQGGY